MKVANLFRDDSNDVGESLEALGFGGGKLGGEAMENGVVSVDDAAGSCGLGKGGVVPVPMSRENGGFCIVVNFDNEGFGEVTVRS